jgi:hypothetical protein
MRSIAGSTWRFAVTQWRFSENAAFFDAARRHRRGAAHAVDFSAVAITWPSTSNRQRANPKEQTKQCSRTDGTAEGRSGAC